jgi:Spy/CpxP family protein refolding chaperone
MKTCTTALGLVLSLASFAYAQSAAPICIVDGVVTDCGRGQPSPQPGKSPADDPFARFLFPIELVMANQQAINLTDRQRTAIQEAMKEAQGRFIDLQFKMSGEGERLQRLLQSSSVDEERVLDQVDRVLTLEREIKRAQLSLMIRVKNQLTEQQQVMLNRLRGQRPGDLGARPDWARPREP